MEIIVIKRYNSPVRAQIAASYLRDNDIECEVNGDNLASVLPLSGEQVTVSVRQSDAERARELLREPEFSEEGEDE